MTTIGFALAVWVMLSALLVPLARLRSRQPLPAATLGMVIAHFGVGLATLGITGVESFKVEKDFALGIGDAATIAGYDFKFAALRDVRGPNYVGVEADVVVSRGGEPVTVLKPQKRRYNSGGNPLSEAGIQVGATRDLFAALGDELGQGRWSVRLQYKPFIRYIWLGAILVALGGLVAALDRRYRRRVTAVARDGAVPVAAMKIPWRFLAPAIAFRGAGRGARDRPADGSESTAVGADRQAGARILPGVARRSRMEGGHCGPGAPGMGAERVGGPGARPVGTSTRRSWRSRARTACP